jgi:hypothetical protein
MFFNVVLGVLFFYSFAKRSRAWSPRNGNDAAFLVPGSISSRRSRPGSSPFPVRRSSIRCSGNSGDYGHESKCRNLIKNGTNCKISRLLDSHSTTQTLTTRTHTHPYEYTYANPTPMSTSEGLSTGRSGDS